MMAPNRFVSDNCHEDTADFTIGYFMFGHFLFYLWPAR